MNWNIWILGLDFLDWNVWIELDFFGLAWLGFWIVLAFWMGLGWIFWIGIFGLNWTFGYLDFLDWDVCIELEYLDTWLGFFGLEFLD